MPLSPSASDVLSRVASAESVPPPPLRSIPPLKTSKRIDYGQLNALCHSRGLRGSWNAYTVLSAHNKFIQQYPKIFLQEKTRLPNLFKQEGRRGNTMSSDKSLNIDCTRPLCPLLSTARKSAKGTEDAQPQQPAGGSHDVAVYVREARGGRGPQKSKEQVEELVAILKKLPIRRTPREHNTVWRLLRTVPGLTSQLSDRHLRTLSKNVVSETWVNGSTVSGGDGLCVILQGRAQVHKHLTEGDASAASLVPRSPHSLVSGDDAPAELCPPPRDPQLRPWSTFGTLEVTAQAQPEPREYSVVTEEDCEILKIPAKKYVKLKLEEKQVKNKRVGTLIRTCPYYKDWPVLHVHDLALLVKWKRFPPGHVIVKSGNVISFVAYINSGYCNVYRNIVGLVRLPSKKVEKMRTRVHMGRVSEKESFGEISVLLQVPFTCTVITGEGVEVAVIEDKDLFELDPVIQQLMLQTAKPTFGHLTDEDVKNEYLQKEQQKEWKDFKDGTLKTSLYYNGITPGFGRWEHSRTSVRKNVQDTRVGH